MHLQQLSESLFLFEDTCNVYLVKDGDAGLLIDAGAGLVTEHLAVAGVSSVEWILHTHHHRDQCWGTRRIVATHGAKVAVPEFERYLFENAEEHWRTKRIFDNYNDRNTFFGPGDNIPVNAVLEDYEVFRWKNISLFVLPAKGHTLGSSALLAEIDGRLVAFTGDLLASGGHLHQLHAMEYGYGDMSGVRFTLQSLQALRRRRPASLLPSHGAPIDDVDHDIDLLEERLVAIARLGPGVVAIGALTADELPEPKLIRISEHLLWGGPSTCSNFYILLSGTGEALFVDYGLASFEDMHITFDQTPFETIRFVAHHLEELKTHFGVTRIEVVIPTHIHDDHTAGIPYLQRHHGTECWALDEVSQVLEAPAEWASTPCTLSKAIRIDQRLVDGETTHWRGYDLTFHYAPGQTEYHSVVSTEVDGRRVAFTGDNYFLQETRIAGKDVTRPFQNTVFRNSFQLAMHRRCVDVMRGISPELICPGHGDLLPCSEEALNQYGDFVAIKEEAFQAVVAEPSDHYIDLFWARMRPYIASVAPDSTLEYTLLLRNNLERRASYAARLLPPPGWTASTELQTIELDPGDKGQLSLQLIAPHAAAVGRALVTAEVIIDDRSQGPIAEALVSLESGAAIVKQSRE